MTTLLTVLDTDLVLTIAQLSRRGLLQEARDLRLPSVQLTCRVRSNDGTSDRLLEFVVADPEHLALPPRDLMHLVGLAETRHLTELEPGERWNLLPLSERVRGHRMDAEIIRGSDYTDDCGIEFDAGYSEKQIKAKMCAMNEAGYTRILWSTSVHARVTEVLGVVNNLRREGELRRIRQVRTRFANFWSEEDPYTGRPRCHKPYHFTYDIPATAPGRSAPRHIGR